MMRSGCPPWSAPLEADAEHRCPTRRPGRRRSGFGRGDALALPLGPFALQLLDLAFDFVEGGAESGLGVAASRFAVQKVLAARVQRHLRMEPRLLLGDDDLRG